MIGNRHTIIIIFIRLQISEIYKKKGYFHHCNIREKIQHSITKARHLGFHQELEIRLKPR